jgi:hypothetical protein
MNIRLESRSYVSQRCKSSSFSDRDPIEFGELNCHGNPPQFTYQSLSLNGTASTTEESHIDCIQDCLDISPSLRNNYNGILAAAGAKGEEKARRDVKRNTVNSYGSVSG